MEILLSFWLKKSYKWIQYLGFNYFFFNSWKKKNKTYRGEAATATGCIGEREREQRESTEEQRERTGEEREGVFYASGDVRSERKRESRGDFSEHNFKNKMFITSKQFHITIMAIFFKIYKKISYLANLNFDNLVTLLVNMFSHQFLDTCFCVTVYFFLNLCHRLFFPQLVSLFNWFYEILIFVI